MRKLDRLDVVSRRVLAGKLHGERRSKKKGQSVEFADYRPYTTGDDLRFIDWNLYARLEKLFLRLFMEEEDLAVSILIDVSASMDMGDPNKLVYAKHVAAALGYIGLVNYNRVHVYSFAETLVDQLEGLRGRAPLGRLLRFLEAQSAQGQGDLTAVCRRFTLQQRQPGVVIVLSDFLDKGDLALALRSLAHPRYDVYAIHVLSPQEIDPRAADLMGDLRLVDCEDQATAEVTVTPALMKRYRGVLTRFCEHVRDQCVRRGAAQLIADTQVPFDRLVLRVLRERGLLG